ncbi:unnamed protein product [Owenia fusiformis]|uniref:Uncharacterized protein n=1 Tax=Owenia fusiformis TaxID=6347 RepID=A0A8S4N0D7_OWEFU|nr:unnamed protein product [Owenia fusiformis]
MSSIISLDVSLTVKADLSPFSLNPRTYGCWSSSVSENTSKQRPCFGVTSEYRVVFFDLIVSSCCWHIASVLSAITQMRVGSYQFRHQLADSGEITWQGITKFP